jgi:hypothetical protein
MNESDGELGWMGTIIIEHADDRCLEILSGTRLARGSPGQERQALLTLGGTGDGRLRPLTLRRMDLLSSRKV